MVLVKKLPNEAWKKWVKRIILHVPQYLSYDGKIMTIGGRQRTVKDLSLLIQNKLNLECLIVQKSIYKFKVKDPYGTEVLGINVPITSKGDPLLGLHTAKMLTKGDAIIYVGGEDAWPFFVKNSKGYHVGVWWDGPIPAWKKKINAIRTRALFSSARSMCCCDTNIINWVRAGSKKCYYHANNAFYIPNYVDIDKLPYRERNGINSVPKILFARRLDVRRGIWLMLEAFYILRSSGVKAQLIICSPEGQEVSISQVEDKLRQMKLEDDVFIFKQYNLEDIYSIYNEVDISVVPTLWSEGTSYSCIESIASGVPVVTTTVGGLPNIVIPEFNGYVVQPRAIEIADAIANLLEGNRWLDMHKNCLSMRYVLSKAIWETKILNWILY